MIIKFILLMLLSFISIHVYFILYPTNNNMISHDIHHFKDNLDVVKTSKIDDISMNKLPKTTVRLDTTLLESSNQLQTNITLKDKLISPSISNNYNPIVDNKQINNKQLNDHELKSISWQEFTKLPFEDIPNNWNSNNNNNNNDMKDSFPYNPILCSKDMVFNLSQPKLSMIEYNWCKWALSSTGGQAIVGIRLINSYIYIITISIIIIILTMIYTIVIYITTITISGCYYN